jgi:hypothetical protein
MKLASLVSALLVVSSASVLACGGGAEEAAPKSPADVAKPAPPAITAFAKRADSQQVDKIGGNDGNLKPDGFKDAAFDVTLRGPIIALYLFSTNDKGEPDGSWQWDTRVANEAFPDALKSFRPKGGMTGAVGVFEGDQALNAANGGFTLAAGSEKKVVVYVADQGAFQAGAHFKLVAEGPDHAIIDGPVLTY